MALDLITGHQGVAHISAEQISDINKAMMNGYGDNKVMRMSGGAITQNALALEIATGYWRANGFDIQIQESETHYIDPSTIGTSRIDNIYVELLQDIPTGAQRAEITIIMGEESASPVAPEDPTEPYLNTDILLDAVQIGTVTVTEGAMVFTDLTEAYDLVTPSELSAVQTLANNALGMIQDDSDAYSSSKAYAVGDLCIHDDVVYKCITACSPAAWSVNQNCFEETTLTDELSTLKDAILKINSPEFISHNIPRLIPKDISAYIADGSFWDRLNGTNGYSLFEDIFVGDYVKMSRAISAPNQDSQYATTGSQYITLIGLDTRMGDGDGGDSVSVINYHHSIWTAGQGFGGTQHFGRKRMNSSNVTTGGYVASEMFTATIGAAVSSGSTASGATINQQLYAEFGSHLKKTRELLTNAVDNAKYNRLGTNSGASSNWAWTTCQAVLMSEIEVYGSTVWSSSGYDTGNANKQFPLFVFSKEAMNNRSAYYWLKDVASGSYFCRCGDGGHSACFNASDASLSVRPRFILAK